MFSFPQFPGLVQPRNFFGGFEGTTPRLATEVSDLHFVEVLPVKALFKKENSCVVLAHLSVTSIVGVSKERIEYEKCISNCSNFNKRSKARTNQELKNVAKSRTSQL